MGTQTGYLSGTTLGRFRIGSLLGRGGMGEVYRAEDAELGRSVALKVLPESLLADEDRLARFTQEARTASALNHPHIVAIYDIGRQAPAGAPAGARPVQYVAMELVAGSSLREAIDRRGLDLKRALDYLAQAADALAAAHAAGIVHRDLKPENLMVADGGYVKVLDFGLAKLQGQPAALESSAATMSAGTSPGVVMGTVGYMSPEQAQGRPVDQRSDIFAFGCILYEVTTGARAFSGNSAVDTLHRIVHDQPEPVSVRMPAAPSELQRIIRKCLAKDPEDRYQSMKEVAIDLRDLRRQLESGAITMPVATVAPRRSLALPIVSIAVIAIAAAAAGYWLSHRGTAAPAPQLDISRVTQSGNVIDAAISPDGKYLAYIESAGGRQSLWYRQINGTRGLELVPGGEFGFWGIVFSADGTSIYYAIKSSVERGGSLFEIPVLGGTPRRVVSGIDSSVSFAPDRTRFAYLRATFPDANSSAVMIAGIDGSGAHPLATLHAPDLFAPGFFASPSWSPDGRRIAATVRNSHTRDARLVVVDATSGAITDMPGRYASATFTEWLPDGSGIVFVGTLSDSGVPGPGGQLLRQPYPSGPVTRISNDLVDYRVGHVTADGRSMLAVGFDASSAIWTAPFGNPAALQAGSIVWDNDGRGILYTSVERANVWRQPLSGGVRQKVTAYSDLTIFRFALSRDGRLALARGTQTRDAVLITNFR